MMDLSLDLAPLDLWGECTRRRALYLYYVFVILHFNLVTPIESFIIIIDTSFFIPPTTYQLPPTFQ